MCILLLSFGSRPGHSFELFVLVSQQNKCFFLSAVFLECISLKNSVEDFVEGENSYIFVSACCFFLGGGGCSKPPDSALEEAFLLIDTPG